VAYGEALPEAPIAINGVLWQPQTNLFDGLSVPTVNTNTGFGSSPAFWDVVEFDLAPQLFPGTNHLLFISVRTTNVQDCVNLCLATVTQPAARPLAPTLVLRRAANQQFEISWSPATPGFTLQSTDSLSPTNWVNAPSGATNPATVPATGPARFYRLFKP